MHYIILHNRYFVLRKLHCDKHENNSGDASILKWI